MVHGFKLTVIALVTVLLALLTIVFGFLDPLDAAKSLQRAKERIAAGISVVVFPEGTRSRDGKLLRFKKGGFLLAAQTGAAIVPVTINGSGALLPAGAWRLRAGTIEVTVGESLPVEGFRPGNLRLLSEQVRERITEHLRPSGASQFHSATGFEQLAVSKRAQEKQGI